jgi:hypothetical protein
MRSVALVSLAVLVSGCTANSGVVPLGNDSFIITKQAATGFSGTGFIKSKALREASAQCLRSEKAVEIESISESRPPYIVTNFPKVELTFKCVAKSSN